MPTETISERLLRPLARPALLAAVRSSPALIAYAAAAVAWLIVAPRSPDLAAQFYRTYLFAHFGMLVWDNNWYAGHLMPGYSLIYPPLSTLIGVRLLGVLTVLVSTVLFSRILAIVYGRASTLGSVFFALAAAGDLWIGRITFALGVTLALASMLTMLSGPSRSRIALASLLGVASALSSPVAGLMLALALWTEIVAERRVRPGAIVIVAILAVMLPYEYAFHEGGFEPYGSESFLASSAVALGFLWALPRRERMLRIGGVLFVIANVLGMLPTPMGSNVVRYAVLLAGPLLLCALVRDRQLHARGGSSRQRMSALATLSCLSPLRVPERRPLPAVLAVLVGIAFWVAWGPVTQTGYVLEDPSTRASFYVPVRDFLAKHARGPVRIEVPFTRSHWESALLARYYPLARGWERQLDKRYNEAIEADPLRASVYHAWLANDGVSYVALPNVPLDGSSLGEAALIRHGAPFLKPVYAGRGWHIYEVLDTRPLAEGPGRLSMLGRQSFTLEASSPGSFLVRVHYTPYWSIAAGAGRIERAAHDWTRVIATRGGRLRVQARFSLSAALQEL
ncbi:MAG: hypothetical protein ACYCUM_14515 [Solirubrobacteraceae bacterium]